MRRSFRPPALRVRLHAGQSAGLTKSSQVMIERDMSLPANRVNNHLGTVSTEELKRIDEALRDWQGL